jgi:Tfp pilus assembly protein PilF
MDTPAAIDDSATQDAGLARQELARLLAAPAFAGAPLQQRLLRHLVECSLAGEAGRLKESLIGIEVYQRPAASFDPRSDSIVRVEARRLRERLRQHYQAEGASSGLAIELPKGSYRPRFVARTALRSQAETQANELLERGHYLLRQGHEDGHRKALARYEEAARLCPHLAAAHSGVARAWFYLVAYLNEPPRGGLDQALAAVRRALQADPRHVDSLVLAAQLTQRFEFDWASAESLYERAAQVAPTSPTVLHAYGFALMLRGEYGAAERWLSQARALDPLHLGMRAHQGLLALYRRDWDGASLALRSLLDLDPQHLLGTSLLAYVHLLSGDAATALELYRAVATAHPRQSIGLVGAVQCLAMLGRQDEARAAYEALLSGASGPVPQPYERAMCLVRLGEPVAAEQLLQQAVEECDPNALCLPVDPGFDSLRQRPGVAALVDRILGRPGRHKAG